VKPAGPTRPGCGGGCGATYVVVLAVVSVAGGVALQAAADTASVASKMVRFIGWTFDQGLNCACCNGAGRLLCQSMAAEEVRTTVVADSGWHVTWQTRCEGNRFGIYSVPSAQG
jgi:hypothetical protein